MGAIRKGLTERGMAAEMAELAMNKEDKGQNQCRGMGPRVSERMVT